MNELIGAGNAFRDLSKGINVYPSVGMRRPHAQLTVNFGQSPFVFDIDDMIRVSHSVIAFRYTTLKVSA